MRGWLIGFTLGSICTLWLGFPEGLLVALPVGAVLLVALALVDRYER